MSKKEVRLNEKLFKQFSRRLRNNRLSLTQKFYTDYEALRLRKIYEDYQQKLVKAGIVQGH